MKILKQIVFILTLILVQNLVAQEFKPYKVKSGKIEYEKLKYTIHTELKFENGVETGSRKLVPYVAEQVIYYWDNYGDISFEEIYQVSKFGGKPLPEKIKIAERLWIDEHRYYYDIKKSKVYDDPFYKKIKCKENFQYYQIKDSWIETIYMGSEKTGTKKLLGKKTDYYKIDNSHDLYAWKGLILKDASYATNRKGDKRLDIDRAKIAIKIDVKTQIDKNIFNPEWLEKYLFYQKLEYNKISELLDARQDLLKQAEENGLDLEKGDVIIYVTSDMNLGKLQILNIENEQLTIKYVNYDNVGEIINQSDNLIIKNKFSCNLDQGTTDENNTYRQDFKWSSSPNNTLFQYCNLGFYLIKSSRTKTKQNIK